MKSSREFNIGVLCLSLFLAANNRDVARALAQSSDSTSPIQLIPRTKEDRERRYQDEHRIVLTAWVTDSTGKSVTGLKANDFLLLDNQKSQKIDRFREVDGKAFTVRAHVIVVLDGVNDDGSSFEHVKKGLDQFLGQDTRPLPFPLSLFFISSARAFETQASTDRAVITSQLAQLARLPRDPDCEQPKLNMFEGVGTRVLPTPQEKIDCRFNHFRESIKALRKVLAERQNARERDRTILIWTGRGWPHAVLHRGNYGDLLVELNTNLRRAHVTLDAVSWSDFDSDQGLKTATGKVPQTPDDIAAEAMRLEILARQNGGRAIARAKNFSEAMSKFINDESDFYMMSFDSAPAPTPDEFHSIGVNVDRPGTTVRTAASYYAQP
jgi:VWFA-related protein